MRVKNWTGSFFKAQSSIQISSDFSHCNKLTIKFLDEWLKFPYRGIACTESFRYPPQFTSIALPGRKPFFGWLVSIWASSPFLLCINAFYIYSNFWKGDRWKLERLSWNDTESWRLALWHRGGAEWCKREKNGERREVGKDDAAFCIYNAERQKPFTLKIRKETDR